MFNLILLLLMIKEKKKQFFIFFINRIFCRFRISVIISHYGCRLYSHFPRLIWAKNISWSHDLYLHILYYCPARPILVMRKLQCHSSTSFRQSYKYEINKIDDREFIYYLLYISILLFLCYFITLERYLP